MRLLPGNPARRERLPTGIKRHRSFCCASQSHRSVAPVRGGTQHRLVPRACAVASRRVRRGLRPARRGRRAPPETTADRTPGANRRGQHGSRRRRATGGSGDQRNGRRPRGADVPAREGRSAVASASCLKTWRDRSAEAIPSVRVSIGAALFQISQPGAIFARRGRKASHRLADYAHWARSGSSQSRSAAMARAAGPCRAGYPGNCVPCGDERTLLPGRTNRQRVPLIRPDRTHGPCSGLAHKAARSPASP